MAILVSDANIFVDMDVAGWTRHMFRLDDTFATPDVLYHDELAEHHAELPGLGLQVETLSSAGVAEVARLATIYREPSTNDLFALALAKERSWPLLSGDRRLREAAQAEDMEIHGTLWLVERMIYGEIITVSQAEYGFDAMRNGNRRLPWAEVTEMLARLTRSS